MVRNDTGYPHIDKPWLKYYSEEEKKIVIPNVNIVDYIKEKNKNNKNSVAETYYGKEFTFDELFYNADLAARALSQVGIKKGDVVANLVSNIPEAGHIWMGATELGAISDFIDPRPDGMDEQVNARKILEVLKYEKVQYIVALDFSYLQMLKPIENELKEMGIEAIIIVSSSDSMSISGQVDYLNDVIKYNELSNSRKNKEDYITNDDALLNKIKMQESVDNQIESSLNNSPIKIVKYKDLISECKNSIYNRISDGNLVNYIGHTSGTSGSRPKPIRLTNKNGIALAEQCEKAKFSPLKDETSFHLLPFFAPAGAYSNFLVNLSTGAKTIDVSEFYIGDFGYLIKKYKPNYLLATPAWLSLLPDYHLLSKEDLSFLRKMIYVGDSMSYEDAIRLKLWLKEHNSLASIESAHGMSELGGCGSYATDDYNKFGSVGIPLPDTIYSLVDPNIEDKLVPIKFDDGMERIEGELVISGPNVTDGKLGNDIVVPHYEMDGNSYIRTKDIAQMDRDGVFYHKDRKDRSFTRIDGFKVKPYEIESVIDTNKYVKSAKIVRYFDEKKNGFMPMCHIVLKDDITDEVDALDVVKDIVYNTIIGNPNMSSRQIPSKFKFRESFPLSKNNKVDFITLSNEDLDGTEISVDVEETNLNVGNINIYKDTKSRELIRK